MLILYNIKQKLSYTKKKIFYFNYKYGIDSLSLTDPTNSAKSIAGYKYIQTSSSLVLWSPVDSIIFSTTGIPVEYSQTGVPQYLGQSPFDNSNAIMNNTNILTDFTVPMDTGLEYNFTSITYYPQSEYRLVDLLGHVPLNLLNITVMWRDKIGLSHFMYLKNNQSSKIKILLRKRNFGNILL